MCFNELLFFYSSRSSALFASYARTVGGECSENTLRSSHSFICAANGKKQRRDNREEITNNVIGRSIFSILFNPSAMTKKIRLYFLALETRRTHRNRPFPGRKKTDRRK